ncbi:MAG: hypothetical protein U0412_03850 [Nitrospira sp.]
MRLQPSSSTTTPILTCPNCGVEQNSDIECVRCGIIFAKCKPRGSASDRPSGSAPAATTPHASKPSLLSRAFRLLPWLSLALTVMTLFLLLKQAPPLVIQTDPTAADRVADKMAHLQMAMQARQRQTTTLNEAELNQWMRENLAIASRHQAQQAGIPVPAGHEATAQEVQSALKDVRIQLAGTQLRAYALFALYGRTISLQLDGTLESREGYIRLKPTAGQIGSLSIPSSTLDHVVHQLFESPQNREQFQLPPAIESIGIVDGRLVITTR